MKKRVILFSTAALVACRGIIGIEDLELADASSTTDAASDTNAVDTASADVVDETKVVKTCNAPGTECRKCCRDNYSPEIQEWAKIANGTGCACASDAGCSVDCSGADTCPPGASPAQKCGKCIDDLLVSGLETTKNPCEKAANDCRANEACRLAVECLEQCP